MLQNLSEIVLEEELATQDEMRKVARLADKQRQPLVVVLVRELSVDEVSLVAALAKHSKVEVADPAATAVDPEALRQVPQDLCERLKIMPISVSLPGQDQTLTVAMADPTDAVAIAELEHVCDCAIRSLVAPLSMVEELIRKYYRELVTEVMPRKHQRDTIATEPATPKPAKPTTQPHHRIADEADTELRLQALIEVLQEKGAISNEELDSAVVALLKRRDQES